MKKLTANEKAAIYYALITGDHDRKTLLTIGRGPEACNKLTDKSISVISSNWWRSAEMVKKREQIERDLNALKEKIEQSAVDEYLKKENAGRSIRQEIDQEKHPKGFINFLNPDEFLKHANEVANSITEEKEKRSWLEMIAKLMNYKEKDDQEATETKKFYIMKTCETCEIYEHCKSCKINPCPKVTF